MAQHAIIPHFITVPWVAAFSDSFFICMLPACYGVTGDFQHGKVKRFQAAAITVS